MKNTRSSVIVLALAVTLLTVAGCGGSKGNGPTAPTNGDPNQVTISSFTYSALTVPVGTSVTWKNDDTVAHTATADAASAFQFDTGNIAAGATSGGVTFTQAGTFPYHCTFHHGMNGSITVQ